MFANILTTKLPKQTHLSKIPKRNPPPPPPEANKWSLANANEDKLYWPIQKRAISDSPFAVGSSQNQTPPTASHCRYLLTLCGSYATTEIVTPQAFANCSHHKSNAIWSAWVGFTELCVYYFQMTINCESFTLPFCRASSKVSAKR